MGLLALRMQLVWLAVGLVAAYVRRSYVVSTCGKACKPHYCSHHRLPAQWHSVCKTGPPEESLDMKVAAQTLQIPEGRAVAETVFPQAASYHRVQAKSCVCKSYCRVAPIIVRGTTPSKLHLRSYGPPEHAASIASIARCRSYI